MTELTHETEHVSKGLARLLSRWRDQPRMVAFVRIILQRIQHLEDVLWDVYTNSWLDTAEGLQLDNLGGIVGEPRKGRQDEQYRLWIRARIAINRANGKVADTLRVARLILESSARIQYIPEYPAAYKVEAVGTTVATADLHALLNEVRPAGVQLTTVVAPDSSNAFILDTPTPLTNGLDHGLLAEDVTL